MAGVSLETLCQEAEEATSLASLRALRLQAHAEFSGELLLARPLAWKRQVNRFHDTVIRRVVGLTEQSLCRRRAMAVPLPYSFVLLGSGGRSEQTLWSDQDNALLYADPAGDEERLRAEAFFTELGAGISANLETIGYPPCSGGVICTNSKWRQAIGSFTGMVRDWLQAPNWEHVRYLLIVADVRTVYGNPAFAYEVKDLLYGYVAEHPSMADHMLRNTLHHKISLGVFGQLIKERYGVDAGGIDVKYGAYIPIVNGIRLLALEAGIRETSTEARIEALITRGYVDDLAGLGWLEAFTTAIKLRAITPHQEETGHFVTRGKLSAEQLTKERVAELKRCLRSGADLQKYVKKQTYRDLERGS